MKHVRILIGALIAAAFVALMVTSVRNERQAGEDVTLTGLIRVTKYEEHGGHINAQFWPESVPQGVPDMEAGTPFSGLTVGDDALRFDDMRVTLTGAFERVKRDDREWTVLRVKRIAGADTPWPGTCEVTLSGTLDGVVTIPENSHQFPAWVLKGVHTPPGGEVMQLHGVDIGVEPAGPVTDVDLARSARGGVLLTGTLTTKEWPERGHQYHLQVRRIATEAEVTFDGTIAALSPVETRAGVLLGASWNLYRIGASDSRPFALIPGNGVFIRPAEGVRIAFARFEGKRVRVNGTLIAKRIPHIADKPEGSFDEFAILDVKSIEALDIEVTGTLNLQAAAIGGETTGWMLTVDRADGAEHLVGKTVDLMPDPLFDPVPGFYALHGKRVTIRGTLTTKEWVERGTQPLIVVRGCEPAE